MKNESLSIFVGDSRKYIRFKHYLNVFYGFYLSHT